MKTLFRVTIAVILTLTRHVNAQRDLTVPAGVTLELTGDGTNQEFYTECTE